MICKSDWNKIGKKRLNVHIAKLYSNMFFNGFLLVFMSFCLDLLLEVNSYIILCLSVVLQNMRVTRRIVLPLLTKALYKFGCFKGILQKAKLALLLFYWVALTRFCMNSYPFVGMLLFIAVKWPLKLTIIHNSLSTKIFLKIEP